jgi:hypothetical protein
LLGKEVVVTGQVGFMGEDSEGMFFELIKEGCLVGVFIETATWNKMPQELRAPIKPGNTTTVMGILEEFEGELEIFVPDYLFDT